MHKKQPNELTSPGLIFAGEAAVRVPEDSLLGFREECDCLSRLVEVSVQVLPASALHVSSLLLLVQRTCVSFMILLEKNKQLRFSL